jgi:hypothetical protein
MATSTLLQLRSIVIDGVAPDIFLTMRARELHRIIGVHADRINAAGYGELFGAIQNAAAGEVTLGIAKLFERPSRSYPTRSIPAAIALMAEKADELPPRDTSALLHDVVRLQIDAAPLRDLQGPDFTRALAAALDARCPKVGDRERSELAEALHALKTNRDKVIAHNEAVRREDLPMATWKSAEGLVSFAQSFIGAIAIGYFGSAFTTDAGWYVPSDYAGIAAMHLDRLLQEAGVVAASPP